MATKTKYRPLLYILLGFLFGVTSASLLVHITLLPRGDITTTLLQQYSLETLLIVTDLMLLLSLSLLSLGFMHYLKAKAKG